MEQPQGFQLLLQDDFHCNFMFLKYHVKYNVLIYTKVI